MSFVLSWSAHQQYEDAVPGGGAGTWVVHPILSPDHFTEIKDSCDNKHENLCKSSPCHFICLCLCCGYCGGRSVRLNGLSPLFKCPLHTFLFVYCLFAYTSLFESMLMFKFECITTKETLGNSFITDFFFFVTYQIWVILQLFKFDLTPHFKALHL